VYGFSILIKNEVNRLTYMFAPIGTYDNDYNYEDDGVYEEEFNCIKCNCKLIVENGDIICSKCKRAYKIKYNKNHNKSEVVEI
jgi:uncharacterized protein YbaR (Trm112 family)